MAYTAAVITVSDKGSKGERADTSGPMLVSLLQAKGYDVVYTKIIPDEKEAACRSFCGTSPLKWGE